MMGTMPSNLVRGIATLSLFLVLGLARAQDSEPYEADPPDRAARLSYIEGDVSMQPADEEGWAPAIVNRPLTTGDKLWTERGARAEIYVGQAAVRLDDDTGFSFLNVDDDTIQMRVTAGTINVSVRELQGNDHIEIDTPNAAVSLLRPGNYRVEVNDAGDATTVKISEGEAEVTGPSQDVIVHAQQAATFRGYENLTAQWSSLGGPDGFDSWTLERERRDDRAASSRTAQYVDPDVTGYEDLDDNGSWNSEPEYGYVWTPRVAVGWSPYQYGRWVWVSPWGWTWIDDAPWGYAPFHYGRWAHVRERWCWVPGPRHVRAVYAPALVGWAGSGVRVSWFPLGPREVYVPGRRFSHRYVERVNVTNTVIVNRTYVNEVYAHRGANVDYRNRHVPGAVTAVSRETFASGGRLGDRRIRGGDADFARMPVSEGPRIAPGRESRLGGATRMNVRVPPRAVVDRQVIVKRDPPSSAARFTRGRGSQEDLARTPTERFERPQDRERPAAGTNLRTQPNVSPQRPVVERPRDDRPNREDRTRDDWQTRQGQERDQQVRLQQDRERQSRDQQARREADYRQQTQRQDDSQRQQRDQQRQQQQQQQQQDRERQSAVRQTEPRERNNPQNNERHTERPRVERPQESRPNNRSAVQRPAEAKPPKQREDQPRPNRD
jgi:hypothetical protein